MAKKAPDAFRTISEVSDALDTPAHVLRFWESKFSQIKPVKRAGGRRYYRPDDIDLLSGIKTVLHEQGMTIKGAQKLLREKGVKHVMGISPISERAQKQPKKAAEKPKKAVKSAVGVEDAVVADQSLVEAIPLFDPNKVSAAPGMLASLTSVNRVTLANQADKLAPIVKRLEALHESMAAS